MFKGTRHKFKTYNAYFYWSTDKQSSFDWFKRIINEISRMDNRGQVEIHNYKTSVHEEGDNFSVFITMLRLLYRAKTGIDIISGTQYTSHFGKPGWHRIYGRIAAKNPRARVGKPSNLLNLFISMKFFL